MKERLLCLYERLRYRVWVVVEADGMAVVFQGNWKECDAFIKASSGGLLLVPKLFDISDQ